MYVCAPKTRIDFKMSVKKLLHKVRKNPKAAISFSWNGVLLRQ